MRLLAYNVQGFRAGPVTVAEAVADERPDVVFVNEAGTRRRLRRFASALGMHAASGLRWFGGLPNAVLVRSPWRILDSRTLRFTRTGHLIPRGALFAGIAARGNRATAVSVHLGLSDREREVHARELTDALAAYPDPILIGGDLNEGPDGRAAAWLAERYWDAFAGAGNEPGLTFSSADPRARIDYVLLGGVRATRAWVLNTPATRAASDHLPMFADVQLEEG